MDLAADEEQQLFRVLKEGASGLLLPGIGFRPFSAPPPLGSVRQGGEPEWWQRGQTRGWALTSKSVHTWSPACVSWFALWEDHPMAPVWAARTNQGGVL